jgi:cytoskeletal protein RodZ
MPSTEEDRPMREKRERRYPPFWEHAVPIAVGILALLILAMIVVIVAVALGVFPGSG